MFCSRVKQLPNAGARCRVDDVGRVRAMGFGRRGFFLKRCHAGVVELVVLVHSSGVMVGSYQAGPWRLAEGRCPNAQYREPFATLPVFDRRIAGRLLRAVRGLAPPEYREGSPSVQARSAPLSRALAYVNTHFDEPLTRGLVAREASVSPSRLSHLFREALGVTLKGYITRLRIGRACSLLRNTSLKLGDIADRVGYDNQSHFGALFRREIGVTPREYRQEAWASADA
jgi:AraC-like DNA-binding protein